MPPEVDEADGPVQENLWDCGVYVLSKCPPSFVPSLPYDPRVKRGLLLIAEG